MSIYYPLNSSTIIDNNLQILQTITKTSDFCVIVYFCLIVRFSTQSPYYQRHQKRKKREVHQPLRWTPLRSKSLDFKPFFNTFACEYPNSYGIISESPPVPLLGLVDFYSTQFAVRQITLLCGIRYSIIYLKLPIRIFNENPYKYCKTWPWNWHLDTKRHWPLV